MGAGFSFGRSDAVAKVQAEVTAKYRGVCGVTCRDSIKHIKIDVNNTYISGGIRFNQACSGNAKCLFDNTINALSSAMFTNKNTANAKDAAGFLGFNIDAADVKTQTDMNQVIKTTISQKCRGNVDNLIGDITILGTGDYFNGPIAFNQTGNAVAACALNSTTTAQGILEGKIDASAVSGGINWLDFIIISAVVLVIIIIIIIVIVELTGKKSQQGQGPQVTFQPIPNEGVGPGIQTPIRRSPVSQGVFKRPVVEVGRPDIGDLSPSRGFSDIGTELEALGPEAGEAALLV